MAAEEGEGAGGRVDGVTGDCVLTTARLVIRPVRLDDADALHPGYVDPEAMRYGSHPPHTDPAETHAKLERNLVTPDWRMWVPTLAGDDRAIGTLAAHAERPGVTEIGYSILPSHWGLGYAREMLAALLDRLFGVEDNRRVFADIDPDNRASCRLVEALGFTREGVLRELWASHIGIRDAAIYGLLAREWALTDLSSSASTRA